jgi:hypothetical protein
MLHANVNVIVKQAAPLKPQNLGHPHAGQRRQLVHGIRYLVIFSHLAPIPDKQLFEFKRRDNPYYIAVVYQPFNFRGRVNGNNPALDSFNHHSFESPVITVNRGVFIFLFDKAVQKSLNSRRGNFAYFHVFKIRQNNLVQIPLHVVGITLCQVRPLPPFFMFSHFSQSHQFTAYSPKVGAPSFFGSNAPYFKSLFTSTLTAILVVCPVDLPRVLLPFSP